MERRLVVVICVVCIGIVYMCMEKGAIYNSSLQLAQGPHIINTESRFTEAGSRGHHPHDGGAIQLRVPA